MHCCTTHWEVARHGLTTNPAHTLQDPVKPGTWQRLANAKNMPPPCLQVPLVNTLLMQWPEPEEISGSENCLFLNVFTPVVSQDHKSRVMFNRPYFESAFVKLAA